MQLVKLPQLNIFALEFALEKYLIEAVRFFFGVLVFGLDTI